MSETTDKIARLDDGLACLMQQGERDCEALRQLAVKEFAEDRQRIQSIETDAIRLATQTYNAMVREAVERANEQRTASIAGVRQESERAMTEATGRRFRKMRKADQLITAVRDQFDAIEGGLTATCLEVAAADPGVRRLVDQAIAALAQAANPGAAPSELAVRPEPVSRIPDFGMHWTEIAMW